MSDLVLVMSCLSVGCCLVLVDWDFLTLLLFIIRRFTEIEIDHVIYVTCLVV